MAAQAHINCHSVSCTCSSSSCHTHTRRTRPTATQDSTAGRHRAVKLQNASTLCCSHDEPDLGPLAEAGASGRQPCRVPSQILQRLTASCSVCQCSSVKTRLSNCDVGAAQRIAIKDRFCASRQHLFVATFTCRPLDVTPPSFGGLRHEEVHCPSGSNAPSRWTSTMARGGREGAAPKDDEVELHWPARRYAPMAMGAYGARIVFGTYAGSLL